MHSFTLLLLGVFTFTSTAVSSVQIEPAVKSADAILLAKPPKFTINRQTPELSTLKQRMAAHHIPAVSIAFMENNKISWTLTEGVIDFVSQREIDKNTVFQTANITKPLVASVLSNTGQNRRVNSDTVVNPIHKSWQFPKQKWSRSKPAPLRHSLGDSRGKTAQRFKANIARRGAPSIITVLESAASPNAKIILDPLSMQHSDFNQSLRQQLANNAALPHRSTGLPIAGLANTDASAAAEGIWTTPSELLKLASEFQSDYQGLDKSSNPNKTASPTLKAPIMSMGNDFYLDKQNGTVTAFSHGGENSGFRANLFIHAETGDGLAIMINSENGGDVIDFLLSKISEIYGWNELSQLDKDVTVLKSTLRELVIDEDTLSQPIPSNLMLVAEGEQF